MSELEELIQNAKFNQNKDNDRIKDKDKPLSTATMKNYISNITKLHKVLNIQMEITNLLWIEQYKDNIINYIDSLDNPNTKKNYLSIIITLLKSEKFPIKNKDDYDKLVNDYLKIIKSNYENIQLHSKAKVIEKKEDEKIITLKEYDDFINLLENKNDFKKEYIMFCILRHFPIRNEVGSFIYIKNKDFKKLDKDIQKNNNWIVEKKEKMEMIRYKFKTANHYINELPFINTFPHPLTLCIKRFVKNNNINSNESLFNLTENQVSHRLAYISHKLLAVKLSTTSVFKILCNDVVKNNDIPTATQLLKEYGKVRGTNIGTIIDHYINGDTNKEDDNNSELSTD